MFQTPTLSIKQTREQLSHVVDQVAVGKKTFVITKFGKPKAAIVPLEGDYTQNSQKINFYSLSGFGLWKNRNTMKDSKKWVLELRDTQSKRKNHAISS